jgi:hypothetical protein
MRKRRPLGRRCHFSGRTLGAESNRHTGSIKIVKMLSEYDGNHLGCNIGAPSRRHRAQPERGLMDTVGELLTWRARAGTWWTHFPAGVERSAISGALLKAMGTGVPDSLLVSEGRFGLEMKNGTRGRLSPAQVATYAAMREAGAVVGTAGVDEAVSLLQEWGVL